MKIVVDVPTNQFKKNDVLLFDGKKWYVVPKEELFSEFEKRHTDAVSRYDEMHSQILKDYHDFKFETDKKLATMATIIEKLVKNKEN